MVTRPHKKLDVWRKSIELTVRIYRLTGALPGEEKFGLVSQMRRAAVSVASNIAEGAARNTKKEFIQFLYTAQGSLSELDTQLLICKKLGFLSTDEVLQVSEDVLAEGKLISGLIRSLKEKT